MTIETKEPNKCLICNLSYSTKHTLKTHEESIHKKRTKYGCQDCGRQFAQKGNLKRHKDSFHKGLRYKCTQCDREFTNPSIRYQHVK